MVSKAAISFIIFTCFDLALGHRDPWLYCDTCLATINEIENYMSIAKQEKIQVGGFRIDKEAEKVEWSKSEIHLNEVLDLVCQSMHLYGVFTNPDTQARHVIRAHAFQGMHTPPSKKHTQTGPDVTNGISYACSVILEEHEDQLIEYFKHREPEESTSMGTKFCVDHAKLCTKADVDAQMWAMMESAMLGIGGNIDKPVIEEDPVMEHVEVEYLDLTDEPEDEGWKAPKRPRDEDDNENIDKKLEL